MRRKVDFFACTRTVIEQWIAAMKACDENRRLEMEAQVAASATFTELADAAFNLLAKCQDEGFDFFKAVVAADLVDAVNAEEGPWVMALRQPAIESLARIHVDDALVKRWVTLVSALNLRAEEDNRKEFSAAAASSLKNLCVIALEKRLGLFTCSYI